MKCKTCKFDVPTVYARREATSDAIARDRHPDRYPDREKRQKRWPKYADVVVYWDRWAESMVQRHRFFCDKPDRRNKWYIYMCGRVGISKYRLVWLPDKPE